MISRAAPQDLPRELFEAVVRYRIVQALSRVERARAAFTRLRRKSHRFDAAKRNMWATLDATNAELSDLERMLPPALRREELGGFDGWRDELEDLFELALEHRMRIDPEG
jgi:hypothetical protein